MADSVRQHLANLHALDSVVVPPELGILLDALEIQPDSVTDASGTETGTVRLTGDLSKTPLPGFDFALTLPTGVVDPAPYKLEHTPNSFRFWLALADQGQALLVFKFIRGIPGLALTGAAKIANADGSVTLTAFDDSDARHAPLLVSRGGGAGAALGPALLVSGTDTSVASMRFTPDTSSTEGVVAFGPEPSVVVFGTSAVGFECPAITIDDSASAAAPGGPGAPGLEPPLASINADDPAWRGIVVRELDFYLPATVPIVGGHPIKGYLEIPTGAGGAELVVETKVPAAPAPPGGNGRPGYSVRIECRDATAVGLSGLVPTLISASIDLPLDGSRAGFDGGAQTIQFAAGRPVVATATLARDPVNSPGEFTATVAVSGQGPDGLLSVTSTAMGGAKIFNTAAALATAIIADKDVDKSAKVGDTPGVVLYGLLAAGAALSSLFTPDSKFVLHGVEIDSTGHGVPIGGPIAMTIDYSVAVTVVEVSVGVLSVEMDPNMPMRIRVRKARLSVDPSASGLQMIALDFDHASMEVEDPGAWKIQGLEPLFDVLGSRSGRGSSWLEVDLGFKLNLGPVKVSEATIRATLDDNNGSISASVRGLEVDVSVPGAFEGSGSLQLEQPNGFDANLRASLLPLNLTADAGIIYAPPMVVLRLGVDLPAPVPLGSTGFGLIGVGGLLGFSATPDYSHVQSPDPVIRQLQWQPQDANAFAATPGETTFGLEAAVGTLPDLGFTFSAKAGVLITVPDLAFRGSLNGKVLQPPVKVSDPSWPPPPLISFLGFVGLDSAAVTFALLGEVDLKPLLEIKVPLAGHFPHTGDVSDWYVYLGADGAPTPPEQGRGIGPISATVLPGILDVSADAYVMVRGKGISGWPYGRPMPGGPLTLTDGFVIAFGFSLQNTFGPKPVVWAELYASLDVMLGSKPPTLAGFGQAGGSLNLGPFSLGVQASVMFLLSDAARYFWAQVTGHIELLFIDIEGTVTIAFGSEPILELPPPSLHPLDTHDADGKVTGSLGSLTDDSYRIVSRLVEDPAAITDEMRVWPDTLVSIPFAITPAISTAAGAFAQFPGVSGPNAAPPAMRVGSEMLHYDWQLDEITLVDVSDEAEADKLSGAGTAPPGQLAAAWQVARTGATGGDVNELILFSNGPDIWLNRVADGGASLPDDPISIVGTICQTSLDPPRPGWAVGYLAAETAAGFHLPADPISLDPLQSRLEAQLHHFGLAPFADPRAGTGSTLLDGTPRLPQPYTLDPAALVPWPVQRDFGRPFDGHLQAPSLHWLDGADQSQIAESGPFVRQEIRLDLSDAISDGTLVLVVPAAIKASRGGVAGIAVLDDRGTAWVLSAFQPIPTGDFAAIYRPPPGAAPVSSVIAVFPLGLSLGVVGIAGVTLSALAAVDNENQQRAALAARLQAAAAAGPKLNPHINLAHQRAILDPDRLYRIDLSFQWAGEIKKQDNSGQLVSVAKKSLGDAGTDEYTPADGSAAPATHAAKRQLFFKTAKKPPEPPLPPASRLYSVWLHKQQDVFQPEMLLRYLGGYEPAQSEMFRFRGDPIRAHFTQDHVAALASAYGFDLQVAVQRVDAPGSAYASPQLLTPLWTFATDSSFLGPVDQRRYAVAVGAPCPVPKPGATATASPLAPLDPEAWYDVHVLATATNAADADGTLPGVTFRTSRWIEPNAMLADLGFSAAGLNPALVISGDVLVATPTLSGPMVVEDDDPAFDAARTALGVDGWPLPSEPRLSRLWTRDPSGRWQFLGLMLESPEPIHRPGRFELTGLTLEMGHSAGAIAFDVRRRDRSGTRLLYLTSTPFIVVTRERVDVGWPMHHWQFQPVFPQLTLAANSIVDGATTAVAATLPLPAAPGFAGDP
jgi:hypothetical protein